MSFIEDKIKTILIFGGSGLFGVHCISQLSSSYKVIATYNKNTLHTQNAIYLNVMTESSTLEFILLKFKPEIIINTIGLVTVDGCEKNPDLAKRLNSKFVQTLVNAIHKSGLSWPHLIHISSDSVYGNNNSNLKNRPWKETDKLNPLSTYAQTKLDGESEVKKYQGPYSILRTAFYGINLFSTKSLLGWIIDNAHNGNPMNGWENVFFSPISAFSLANTVNCMIKNKIVGVYNVSSLNECNKYDFIDAVCSNLNIPVELNRVRVPETTCGLIRPNYCVLDSSKLQAVLPFQIEWQVDLQNYMSNLTSFTTK
jgi:dTDP-4-dehydrorhamnose reductase